MTDYRPPCTITPEIVALVEEIGEALGRLGASENVSHVLRLRRVNRIRTIQGSLAIEGNTLSEEQITAIMDGERIVAPPREILEARNAIAAYDMLHEWNPAVSTDLLEAHRVLMEGLHEESGRFRTGGVGVVSGEDVVHMAPSASRVPTLVNNLLAWLSATKDHPLIASSVFHYEFEFIHPFADGNGRMGRLWQSLILSRWNSIFENLPVESLIHQHQSEHYRAIQRSSSDGESSAFVEFLLSMILETLAVTPQGSPQVAPQVLRLLKSFDRDREQTRDELQRKLRLRDRKSFRQRYLQPALDQGWIEMTLADNPTSPLQKYRLTAVGRLQISGK